MNKYKNLKAILRGDMFISSVSTFKNIVIFTCFLGLFSCSGDSLQPSTKMEYLYAESNSLCHVSPDSIQRFATKVQLYLNNNPALQADPLLSKILENIHRAAYGANINIRISIDTEWDGVTIINF